MKKILIASTALVAAGMLTSGQASASEKIKLSLGGFSKWWVVGQFNDKDYMKAAKVDYNNVDIKGDNEIFFGGSTTLDNGMVVGVQFEREAGGHTDDTQDPQDKSYMYVETAYGKVILGNEANGTALLHVMAPDAAGNIDSDGIITGGFAIAQAGGSTMVSTSIDTDGEAEKITYVAPTFYGLTLGASYIPNATKGNRGLVNNTTTVGEIYGVGALYARTFADVEFKLSGGWVTYGAGNVSGAATNQGSDQVNEYSTGMNLGYKGFTVGGAYRKIEADRVIDQNDAQAYDAGIMYATGPYAVSFYYFHSEQEGTVAIAANDKSDIYQVSGKYSMGPGVDLLATIGHAKYDDETTKAAGGDTLHNEGWAVMTGLGLAF